MGPCSRNQASWWHAFVLGPCSRNQAPLSTSVFDHLPLIQFLVSCIYQLDVCENSCPSHALWLTTFCSFQWGRRWRNIRRSTHSNWGYLCVFVCSCVFVFHWYDCVSTVMWVHVVSEGSVRSSLTCYMNHRWIWARLLLQMKQWQLRWYIHIYIYIHVNMYMDQ